MQTIDLSIYTLGTVAKTRQAFLDKVKSMKCWIVKPYLFLQKTCLKENICHIFIIGDKIFLLKFWLLKPFGSRGLTTPQQVFQL